MSTIYRVEVFEPSKIYHYAPAGFVMTYTTFLVCHRKYIMHMVSRIFCNYGITIAYNYLLLSSINHDE